MNPNATPRGNVGSPPEITAPRVEEFQLNPTEGALLLQTQQQLREAQLAASMVCAALLAGRNRQGGQVTKYDPMTRTVTVAFPPAEQGG